MIWVLDDQPLELGDDSIPTPAYDFGFGAGGVDVELVLCQRGRKRIDESEVAQILEHRTAPLRQRRGEVPGGRLGVSRRGGLPSGVLLDDESADVTVDLVGLESIPRRRAHQRGTRIQ